MTHTCEMVIVYRSSMSADRRTICGNPGVRKINNGGQWICEEHLPLVTVPCDFPHEIVFHN